MIKANHTQVPNDLMDRLMSELKGSELKVFLCICRKTIGWHKETDKVSISQLMDMTGLSNRCVIDATKSLESKKIIIVLRVDGEPNTFEIGYEESSHVDGRGVKKVHRGCEESSQVAYEESSHTKETITKETKQKKVCNAQFDEFWNLYDKKKGKKKTKKEWDKLNSSDVSKILENVPVFKTHFSDEQYLPYPRKYLYNRYWEDEDFQEPNLKQNGKGNTTSVRQSKGDRRFDSLKSYQFPTN